MFVEKISPYKIQLEHKQSFSPPNRKHCGIQNKFTWNCTWLDIMTTKTTDSNCLARMRTEISMCQMHKYTSISFLAEFKSAVQCWFLFVFSMLNFCRAHCIVFFIARKWRFEHYFAVRTQNNSKRREMRSRFFFVHGLVRTKISNTIYGAMCGCGWIDVSNLWCFLEVVQMTQWPHCGWLTQHPRRNDTFRKYRKILVQCAPCAPCACFDGLVSICALH